MFHEMRSSHVAAFLLCSDLRDIYSDEDHLRLD